MSIRLSMRFSDADVAIIDRAAHLRGCSRTDFIHQAAMRAANGVFIHQLVERSNPDQFDAFSAAIEEPGLPVSELVDVLLRRAPWDEA